MEYVEEDAVVAEVREQSLIVFSARPEQETVEGCHGCGTKSGCGVCAQRPGAVKRRVPASHAAEFKEGDLVHISSVRPPYMLSVFLVFVLPLLMMIALPALSMLLAGWTGRPLFKAAWLIVCLGLGGVILAFAVSSAVDRLITRAYPPTIRKTR